MDCPNCSHHMQQLGCCVTIGMPFHWCPNCGSIKPCDIPAVAPAMTSMQDHGYQARNAVKCETGNIVDATWEPIR